MLLESRARKSRVASLLEWSPDEEVGENGIDREPDGVPRSDPGEALAHRGNRREEVPSENDERERDRRQRLPGDETGGE